MDVGCSCPHLIILHLQIAPHHSSTQLTRLPRRAHAVAQHIQLSLAREVDCWRALVLPSAHRGGTGGVAGFSAFPYLFRPSYLIFLFPSLLPSTSPLFALSSLLHQPLSSLHLTFPLLLSTLHLLPSSLFVSPTFNQLLSPAHPF